MPRKAKEQPLGFSDWIRRTEYQAIGTQEMRQRALQSAARELAEFVRLTDGTPDELLAIYRDLVERACTELRKDMAEQLGTAPPMQTRKRLERVASLLAEAQHLINEDWKAGLILMNHFEAPDETYQKDFVNALIQSSKLAISARKAAEADGTGSVTKSLFGRTSSNFPILKFLHLCRMLMVTISNRNVALRKTDCALLRFARPLYTYATGHSVKDGAWDRQIQELRHIPAQ